LYVNYSAVTTISCGDARADTPCCASGNALVL
jgi:hypothetical protein